MSRFGGLDTGATYGASTTTGLQGQVGAKAKFVNPLGMAVDTSDPAGEAIYVLDNVNPQALGKLRRAGFPSLKLEYRIQKLSKSGDILASTKFTLESSSAEPGLHAVSLAVDGPGDRVYVLIVDTPPTVGNEEGAGGNAADRIEAWTAGRKNDQALVTAGQLIGVGALQPGKGKGSIVGDVAGESIAVDRTTSGVDLALAGNEYLSADGEETSPVIERIATGGAQPGSFDGEPWKSPQDIKATEDAAAMIWGAKSSKLFSLSANMDGSLNVALGHSSRISIEAQPDLEPNMAKVSPDLKTTEAILPWQSAVESGQAGQTNYDRAATVLFGQDEGGGRYNAGAQPSGATGQGGTLAPSVVKIAGEGVFSGEAYAGLVVQRPGRDPQSGKAFSWTYATSVESLEETFSLATPASLAIRIFDAQGESLGMIGNVTANGPCNLQGGPAGDQTYSQGSFVALVPGSNGVLYALVQPDLDGSSEAKPIDPAAPIAGGMGDQVVEFAPGAGQNEAPGKACPQPLGGFSITAGGSEPSKGSDPVTVVTGTKLKFDASEAILQSGSPWAYNWDLANGSKEGILNHGWTASNEFASEPGAPPGWRWPLPFVEFTYAKPGSYTAKLSLVNDFGTLAAQRVVNVVAAVQPTACFGGVEGVVGQPVTFDATCSTVPQFDSILSYQWSFGDEQGESQPAPQIQHSYSKVGQYVVKLTVTDLLGHKAESTQTVTVGAPKEEGKPAPKEEGKPSSPPAKEESKSGPKAKTVALTRAQQLAKALQICKKAKPKKRRASCEKQAKKKFGPSKHVHKHRRGKRR